MNKPIDPGRLILATILVPFLSILLVACRFSFPDFMLGQMAYGYDAIRAIGAIALFGSILVGWPNLLLTGLPVYGILCHKNKRIWYHYAAAGSLVGAIESLAVPMIFGSHIRLGFLPFGILTGAVIAILFDLIRGPHLALTASPKRAT